MTRGNKAVSEQVQSHSGSWIGPGSTAEHQRVADHHEHTGKIAHTDDAYVRIDLHSQRLRTAGSRRVATLESGELQPRDSASLRRHEMSVYLTRARYALIRRALVPRSLFPTRETDLTSMRLPVGEGVSRTTTSSLKPITNRWCRSPRSAATSDRSPRSSNPCPWPLATLGEKPHRAGCSLSDETLKNSPCGA